MQIGHNILFFYMAYGNSHENENMLGFSLNPILPIFIV